MSTQKLTIVERQLLLNQFEILSRLNQNDGINSDDYILKMDILLHGYTAEYEEVFAVFSDELPIEICEETNDILNMYRSINNFLVTLDKEDQKNLELNKIEFAGFDLNNDDHYSYANFMIKRLGRWDEYKDMYLNSHDSSHIHRYRRLLKCFKADMQLKNHRVDLETINKLIEAAFS